MTVEIEMQGSINAIRVAGEFKDVIAAMEIESTKNRSFIATVTPDGDPVAFHMPNILTIREID